MLILRCYSCLFFVENIKIDPRWRTLNLWALGWIDIGCEITAEKLTVKTGLRRGRDS